MSKRVDLKDASISEIADELRERGWRMVPAWVFATLSAGINTGYWTTREHEDHS